MKPCKKHIRFFLSFFLFTAIVAGTRFYWIQKAMPSKATVLYTDQTSFTRPIQYYPVVSYESVSGEVVTRGTYNLPINPGEVVGILYNPDDVQEFRLNTTYWLWHDIWSWYRLIWVAIVIYYLVFIWVKRNRSRAILLIVDNAGKAKSTAGFDPSTITLASTTSFSRNNGGTNKMTNRLPRWGKAVLLLMLPATVFLIGQIWNIPYAREIAVIIFLGLVALGSPSGPTPDSEL